MKRKYECMNKNTLKITIGGKWLGEDDDDNDDNNGDLLSYVPKETNIMIIKNKFQGDLPNLKWKAFSKSDLYSHKRYIPLPTMKVIDLKDEKLYKYIPQDDPHWKEIRLGRLTASRAAAALGFMEIDSVEYLKMGKYMIDHQSIVDVYEKLKDKKFLMNPPSDITAVRMEWGTHHEVNAIINFLNQSDQFIVKETGFELLTRKQILSVLNNEDHIIIPYLPSIGASPDFVLQIDNKEVALGECKCPCPFREATDKDTKSPGKFCYKSYTYAHKQIPLYYIPQMMLQMLVTNMKKCIYFCYTPTKGCTMFEVKFNKEYCRLMLIYFAKFNKRFVIKNKKPSKNPFINESLYKTLLDMTLAIQLETSIKKREISPEKTSHNFKNNKIFLD